ncbi:hypothetical protein [Stigmatella aurantiaca]|nr:hypothetical protein [Stigmatella aurantiaca]
MMFWAVTAFAQQPAPALREQAAWAQGVSPEQRKAAAELLEQGNRLLKDSIFTEAEKKYVEALKYWKHPAIYYNLALALLNLDRPSEVYEYMVASTRYAEGPLGEERFKHALKYIERVEKENARVSLSCTNGTRVTLKREDQLLPIHCERFERLLRPGSYTLIATQNGTPVPDTALVLAPGEHIRYRLGIESRRRWAAWMPWAVLGSGVAVAVGGRLIHMKARDEFQAFDSGVDACGGCVPGSELSGIRTRARTLQAVSMGTYAVGGAAFATGMVLLYVNRLQPQMQLIPLQGNALTVVPVAAAGESGLLASYRF